MIDDTLHDQAVELECILPRLIRRLFTLEAGHPVAELPLAQLRVCIILQAGTRPISVVSEELGISVSATTQIADRLERTGMVERVVSADDRRQKNLQLTSHGRQLMESRQQERIRRVELALARLMPEQRAQALYALSALLEAILTVAPEVSHEDPCGARQEQ